MTEGNLNAWAFSLPCFKDNDKLIFQFVEQGGKRGVIVGFLKDMQRPTDVDRTVGLALIGEGDGLDLCRHFVNWFNGHEVIPPSSVRAVAEANTLIDLLRRKLGE